MSIAKLAQDARLSLGRGLEALQASGNPPQLVGAAQPLAQALRVLVEVEGAPDTASAAAAEPAVAALREGLRLVQMPEIVGIPAAESAMSAIAEALGRVLELSRQLAAREPSAAKGEAAARPRAADAAAPAKAAAAPAKAAAAPAKAAPVEPPLAAKSGAEPPLREVEAALGAHSATNFYKGLASGDVVTSGGLFIATYQLPEVGQKLLLKVSMPGGYAFEAKGVVAWRREVPLSTTAAGAQPGFGAQISEISDEGRGLIQRYVRNREPLFHDDL